MEIKFCKSIAIVPEQPVDDLEKLDHPTLQHALERLASFSPLENHLHCVNLEASDFDVKLGFVFSQTGKDVLENIFWSAEHKARNVMTKLVYNVSLSEDGTYWTSEACWTISAISRMDKIHYLHRVANSIVHQLDRFDTTRLSNGTQC